MTRGETYEALIAHCALIVRSLRMELPSEAVFCEGFSKVGPIPVESVLRELTVTESKLVFLLFSLGRAFEEIAQKNDSPESSLVFVWLFGGMIGKVFAMLNGAVLMEFAEDARLKAQGSISVIQVVGDALCFVAMQAADVLSKVNALCDLEGCVPASLKVQ